MSWPRKIILELPIENESLLDPFVEECLRDGVALIAIRGERASHYDDVIDEIVVGDGSDPDRFIVTSYHETETLDEVLEFTRHWDADLGPDVEIVRL